MAEYKVKFSNESKGIVSTSLYAEISFMCDFLLKKIPLLNEKEFYFTIVLIFSLSETEIQNLNQ